MRRCKNVLVSVHISTYPKLQETSNIVHVSKFKFVTQSGLVSSL